MSETDPNAARLAVAQRVFARVHAEHGEHLIAAAVYGSVARAEASAESDVELTIITDETVEYADAYCFEQGILVEYTMVPAARMLAASRRVTPAWGIEADQYRRHLVLWDPTGFFPTLWRAARDIPDGAFAEAAHTAWWHAFEGRGKYHNAARMGDLPRIHYTAWQFAYMTALRIALHERRPYTSGRTIWTDVVVRGYGMSGLLAALTAGSVDHISAAIELVWAETQLWGKPEQ
ncbi:MAG TPA: kanamycin nucleotidyltransferase C-terminal domain-containing protein [Ktedonobacterales bacterium]|nr:kanamycin nucleotidyltransferase C-terminal domain-containing protein [Ktedonobacterales bacterium]